MRLVVRDDLRQTAMAERFIEKGVWISLLALAEAIWVLGSNYRLTPEDQAATIEMLLTNTHVVLQDREVVAAALQLFRARPAPGFSDCLMLEIARKAGHLPPGTFDRTLARVDGAHKL